MNIKRVLPAVLAALIFSGCTSQEFNEPKKYVLVSSAVTSENEETNIETKKLPKETDTKAITKDSSSSERETDENVIKESTEVYYTKTGKRYHTSESCAGKTALVCTLDEALEKGLTPCKKCVQ